MSTIKAKFADTQSYDEKASLLTLAPTYWSIEKTAAFFNTTVYMVREGRKLKEEKGILSVRDMKPGSCSISCATKKCIIEFFESESNSKILPGKKDVVSVKTENGREHKQKVLILCNLKELYVHFKEIYPDAKVGFSTFADLRPKWCVLAGSSGTHSVCVCSHHENLKLKLSAQN